MKNYFIGFILVLISLFSFDNYANALETKDFYFDSENYITTNRDLLKTYGLIDKFNDLFNYIEENSKYEYLFSFGINNGKNISMRLFLIQDVSKVKLFQVVGDNYPEIMIGNSDYIYVDTIDSFNINLSDTNWDEFFENFKLNFDKKNNTPNWWKLYYMNTFLYVDENNYIKNDNSFFLKSSFDLNLSLNEYENNSKIIFDNGFVLEEGVSLQSFINQLNIFDQTEYPLTYRTSFNNDMNIDLDKITFDYSSAEYIDGTIKVFSKVSVSNYVTDSEKFPKFIDLDFKGHYSSGPGGGTTIEYDLNDYFTYDFSVVDEVSYYDYIFEFKLIKDLPHEYMRITVTYDFETFDNDYYFDLYDNCRYATFYDYIATFLNGYRKYTFPVDYDLAIIRSKSFEDLESFFISGKLDFEYALYDFKFFTYDFNNKKFNYNYFNYEDYLINEDYFKLPLKIDETNNIFPVIFNSRTDITSSFYLKDDLFVEFINSDTLDSYLDNITNDEFNQNNDLEIDDSFSTDVDINLDNSSVDFHDSFTFSLDYFKDSIKTIFLDVSYLFNNLPGSLKYFYILIFGIILFIFLIRFIL